MVEWTPFGRRSRGKGSPAGRGGTVPEDLLGDTRKGVGLQGHPHQERSQLKRSSWRKREHMPTRREVSSAEINYTYDNRLMYVYTKVEDIITLIEKSICL